MRKKELESKSATELAVLCNRVADNASAYSMSISGEARKMKEEWTALQMASEADYEKHTAAESQKAALKERMVEFLSAVM